MYGGGVMQVASTMLRAQNRAAKSSTLLQRQFTLPIWVYYFAMMEIKRYVGICCSDTSPNTGVTSEDQVKKYIREMTLLLRHVHIINLM